MNIKITEKLNPICEILGLLFVSENYEMLISRSIKELDSHGVNGELFIKKNFKIIDKYIKEFNKYKVVNKKDLFLLEEEDSSIFIILALLIIKNEKMISSLDDFSEEELKMMILDIINEAYELENSIDDIKTLNNILGFLRKLDIAENIKWKLMLILESPKSYYKDLIEELEKNRGAYNEAYKVIEKKLPKLISDLSKYIKSGKCEIITNNKTKSSQNYAVIPTLAFVNSLIEIKDTYFVGLLYEIIHKEHIKAIGNKGEIILKLKALADKSKLDIISLIKGDPKYSLEIAKSLSLTPATVSYHMATLLESNMVIVEKKNGKVYYSLNNEGIEKFIEELNRVLL
ncbi:ArsR/SmtB family transcription factor [Clostridium sp. MB05]|uniref:ArsR/SmtB family transcription factor n=1 Tax=Clostridium sp. MB05 TaxID=3376682 RepID=UPI003981B398